ncbi:MAG TPA: aldo/keto reductase [Acidobacteriaceae bacterium]
MQYVNLGRSGLMVSRLCLGCMSFGEPGRGRHAWTLDDAESGLMVRAALEAGINFFDTANEYAGGTSEEILGRWIERLANRDEVVIATKAFWPWRNAPNTGGLSRKALFHAVDDSLKRLGTDYIDLFQIHRFDQNTATEEIMETLHDIVKSGRARYVGASSMRAWQFAKAQHVAERNGWTRFISMQPQVNLVYREEEREMIPLCIDQGVAVIPWSPLARGMLARPWNEKTRRSETDQFSHVIYDAMVEQNRKIVEALAQVSSDRGLPMAQIATAWLLAKPGITAPIVGVTKIEQLTDPIAALDLKLPDQDIARLEGPYISAPVAGLLEGTRFIGPVTVKN